MIQLQVWLRYVIMEKREKRKAITSRCCKYLLDRMAGQLTRDVTPQIREIWAKLGIWINKISEKMRFLNADKKRGAAYRYSESRLR